MNLWAVQASETIDLPGGAHTTRQLPTFYIDADVQGCLTEADVISVAKRILRPWGNEGGLDVAASPL